MYSLIDCNWFVSLILPQCYVVKDGITTKVKSTVPKRSSNSHTSTKRWISMNVSTVTNVIKKG